MKVKCIGCLAKKKLKDAEVIYRGFSYCREHFINAVKGEEKIFKKMAEKEKKEVSERKFKQPSSDGGIMKIGDVKVTDKKKRKTKESLNKQTEDTGR
jgi:hypothetical protein